MPFGPFVTTHPQMLSTAAGELQAISSAMTAQNAAAAGPTSAVVPAALDEVSTPTAAQLATHAGQYQAIAAQATATHQTFVNTLGASASSYAATEAANATAAG
jgi:hypothetical protein